MPEVPTIPAPESSLLICDDRSVAREELVRLLTPASGMGRIPGGSRWAPFDQGVHRAGGGPSAGRAAPHRSLEHRSDQPAAGRASDGGGDRLRLGAGRGPADNRDEWCSRTDAVGSHPRPVGTTIAPLHGSRHPNSVWAEDSPPLLTEQELQVQRGISNGRSNQEIGQQLALAVEHRADPHPQAGQQTRRPGPGACCRAGYSAVPEHRTPTAKPICRGVR